MISSDKLIILDITKDDVMSSIDKAKGMSFSNNLRNRNPTLQFDCKIRGYLGEIGLTKWLQSYNIKCWSNGQLVGDMYSADIDLNIRGIQKDYKSEIKTSAKPDRWYAEANTDKVLIRNCIEQGDIKIFARNNDYHIDLDRDIYIQIYFGVKRQEHDSVINALYEKHPDFLRYNNEDIYQLFHFIDYMENTYFVGWMDRESIIKKLDATPVNERTWQFEGSYKTFWKCNIKDAYYPITLINYIKA